MGRLNRFSRAEKLELWRRWRAGVSASAIARDLKRSQGSVFTALALRGGISPVAQTRSVRTLSLEEREEISLGLARNESIRSIARRLSRNASTISREIKRNSGHRAYRAVVADKRAWRCAKRPKRCKLGSHRRLQQLVAYKLASKWSPEQIAGWLKLTFSTDPTMRVSHETIYRSLFIQTRGVLKKQLQEHLRTHRVMRQAKQSAPSFNKKIGIVDAVSIRERPAEAADRAIPGHWEGDLLAGSHGSYIATLVERSTRFTMLIKVPNKDSLSVIAALKREIQKLPNELVRSLTWDRGSELARHAEFTVATDVKVYFCDPRSPWQRGTNENTNGLLRQYFPKGTNLGLYAQADLNKVARELNSRPRKTLDYKTPADRLRAIVALTG